jgi:hypothetical protein
MFINIINNEFNEQKTVGTHLTPHDLRFSTGTTHNRLRCMQVRMVWENRTCGIPVWNPTSGKPHCHLHLLTVHQQCWCSYQPCLLLVLAMSPPPPPCCHTGHVTTTTTTSSYQPCHHLLLLLVPAMLYFTLPHTPT